MSNARLFGAATTILLMAAFTACSATPESTDSAVPGSATPQTIAPRPTREPSSPEPNVEPGGATASAPGTAEPLFGGLARSITLRTPASGGGSRPRLEWEPVVDADHYGAYVYAPDRSIYWAWAGRETSVHVGGEPQLREGAQGPSVVEGMSWAVIAYDSDLLPIAVSELRLISP